ncbi:lysylphosphatidylglycerol synthase transmembrane domain-containing protein [Qingshengfaniella alkalisoli]|uniref:Flippase-like domain-containing protein n=1 Tax=Qingshengfaniella alkalisoli TaxID=2599296 RepID=A0A5B8IZI4_9RHOB|nr:lysylphosphatidylglycerol synthase transmembrane domain-containing protein [Qingshengfaniella alkalisoli]QDY71094.1 flippase-like domain-containing protein [Qingshengfaniella alkalisoli]
MRLTFSSKPHLLRAIRIAVPIVTLVVVLMVVDVRDIVQTLRATRLWPLLMAGIMAQVVILASATRWSHTTRQLGHPVPLRVAVREYYVSSFLNATLPGGISGDALRVWRNRDNGGPGISVRGVMIERLAGQVALALCLLIGILTGGIGHATLVALVFIAALSVLLIALLVGGRLAGKIGIALSTFGPALKQAWVADGAWRVQAPLNLIVITALIGCFALCTRAIGTQMDVTAVLVLVPVCLAAMIIPTGIGGLGLREGAAAALWPLAGFSAEAGVAAALLFGVVNLLSALPGALFLLHPHVRTDHNR